MNKLEESSGDKQLSFNHPNMHNEIILYKSPSFIEVSRMFRISSRLRCRIAKNTHSSTHKEKVLPGNPITAR